MDTYIATFYSHYGALSFCKHLEKAGVKAKPSPVPRKLSSSCGVCVRFDWDNSTGLTDFYNDDMEAIYLKDNDDYVCIISHS